MYDTDNCLFVKEAESQSVWAKALSVWCYPHCWTSSVTAPRPILLISARTLRHYRSSQSTVQGSVGVTWGRDALLDGESVQTSNNPKNKTWSAGFGHYETRIWRHLVPSDLSCCAQCACGHPAVCRTKAAQGRFKDTERSKGQGFNRAV